MIWGSTTIMGTSGRGVYKGTHTKEDMFIDMYESGHCAGRNALPRIRIMDSHSTRAIKLPRGG